MDFPVGRLRLAIRGQEASGVVVPAVRLLVEVVEEKPRPAGPDGGEVPSDPLVPLPAGRERRFRDGDQIGTGFRRRAGLGEQGLVGFDAPFGRRAHLLGDVRLEKGHGKLIAFPRSARGPRQPEHPEEAEGGDEQGRRGGRTHASDSDRPGEERGHGRHG